MKFYEQFNKYMEEADIEKLAKQDSREEYEDELDKKEAYKANLLRQDEEPEDEIDPLTDPMFQQALDILEDLQARSPDKFEKFVTRLMDIVDYRKGVSL
jgi:hypothetical protein